jgi:excisionase family DNA binding protein
LNVSRTYVIGMIDNGTLPARMVGNQRRLPLKDVLAYKTAPNGARRSGGWRRSTRNSVSNERNACARRLSGCQRPLSGPASKPPDGVRTCFQARWSDREHQEWIAALLRNRRDLTCEQLARTRRLMDESMMLSSAATSTSSTSRPCARRLRDLAVGMEECSRRGSNQRMDARRARKPAISNR